MKAIDKRIKGTKDIPLKGLNKKVVFSGDKDSAIAWLVAQRDLLMKKQARAKAQKKPKMVVAVLLQPIGKLPWRLDKCLCNPDNIKDYEGMLFHLPHGLVKESDLAHAI